MMKYQLLTKQSTLNATTDKELEKISDDQYSILLKSGYDVFFKEYAIHFFESAFGNERTEKGYIHEEMHKLAIKDGCDLVRWENGNIGFIAYYSGETSGFEIIRDEI